jgi:hypothetical protein
MLRYGAVILLSSFLLFQVQPLIGKRILPWFGATAAMWTTCMLFFQLFLLASYLYAHIIVTRLSRNHQALLHVSILALSIVTLFFGFPPQDSWKPLGYQPSPELYILALLASSVGVPYFMVATTAPLLLAWFHHQHPSVSPHRLYALSNTGSLLGLISYPFLFEPFFTLQSQALMWRAMYIAFAVGCAWCAMRLFEHTLQADQGGRGQSQPERDLMHSYIGNTDDGTRPQTILLWFLLATSGSVMLLATTNRICENVAVIPFLWVVPLALYLLSYIICFGTERVYSRGWWSLALVVALVFLWLVFQRWADLRLTVQITIYCAVLFVICMCCHGELVRLKPVGRSLTLFYLMIAAGGAFGGFIVSFAAPLLFEGLWEYHLGLVGSCLLVALSFAGDRRSTLFLPSFKLVAHRPYVSLQFMSYGKPWWLWSIIACLFGGLLVGVGKSIAGDLKDVVVMSRDYYGTLRVLEHDYGALPIFERFGAKQAVGRSLYHGQVLHGFQFLIPRPARSLATAYYTKRSGVGLALQFHPRRFGDEGGERTLHVGGLGLGVGTIAAHAIPGDRFRFYELNPTVERMAREYFGYLSDSEARGAKVDVVLGDGRIALERELRERGSNQFDILVVDAFSSDAIPVHLLTRECFDTYWSHLKEDGILAINITNRYLDLRPVVRGAAEEVGKEAVWVVLTGSGKTSLSNWILITSNPEFVHSPAVEKARRPLPRETLVWTDDYSNLVEVVSDRRDRGY